MRRCWCFGGVPAAADGAAPGRPHVLLASVARCAQDCLADSLVQLNLFVVPFEQPFCNLLVVACAAAAAATACSGASASASKQGCVLGDRMGFEPNARTASSRRLAAWGQCGQSICVQRCVCVGCACRPSARLTWVVCACPFRASLVLCVCVAPAAAVYNPTLLRDSRVLLPVTTVVLRRADFHTTWGGAAVASQPHHQPRSASTATLLPGQERAYARCCARACPGSKCSCGHNKST